MRIRENTLFQHNMPKSIELICFGRITSSFSFKQLHSRAVPVTRYRYIYIIFKYIFVRV